MKQKMYALLGVLLFLVLLYGNLPIPQLFIYNHTESIPKGWYLIFPCGRYEVDDIVGYDVPGSIKMLAQKRGWMRKRDIMMKRIGAMGGDTYEITPNREFFVRGKYIGKVFSQDRQGQPMPSIPTGRYRVGAKEFLPATSHPYSFDGRYYGPIGLDKIKFKAIPITAFYF